MRRPFGYGARGGQTLVIALIILFVLLLLGFVFLGVVNRNILQSSRALQRSLAADLADAGVRYAHDQLLNSLMAADWRPGTTKPIDFNPTSPSNQTIDPDIFYIRPPALNPGGTASAGYKLHDSDLTSDMGGPDGLGPFTRIPFKNGRALIRVRFAASDIDVTQTNNTVGPLREPGKAHNYLIIESVGRPGVLNPNDPTTLPSTTPIQYQNFASQASLQSTVGAMGDRDNQFVESRKLIAFADIGLTDYALFISNKDHSTRPADIGVPLELGVTATDDTGNTADITPVQVPLTLGGPIPGPGGTQIPGGGSIYSNADVQFQGMLSTTINTALGEGIFVAGNMAAENSLSGAQSAAITVKRYAGATLAGTDSYGQAGNPINSSDPAFTTNEGTYRDGTNQTDAQGNPRSVQYKPSPSIENTDPNTGDQTYKSMTRDSGTILAGGNSGQYGYGANIYVNNKSDIQTQTDETGRIASGSAAQLIYDWLNPNSGVTNSGWQGPFYVPPAAYVQLTPDGFYITRNGSGPSGERTWRNPDGTDSGLPVIRYRIGPADAQGRRHIVNTLTPGVTITDSSPNYSAGPIFGGVLFFEGNVRIRGTIPTNVQLTVVSMGNVYVEGSITKGIQDSSGRLISQPSTSMIALLARDYVVLNTTQFFGPAVTTVTQKNSTSNPAGLSPIVMAAANGNITLFTELLLDPEHGTNNAPPSLNPNNWPEFEGEYLDPSTQAAINTKMLLTHSMDQGSGANAYVANDINYGTAPPGSWVYFWPQSDGSAPPNYSNNFYTFGQQTWQQYPRFESRGFDVLSPQNPNTGAPPAAAAGNYEWNLQQVTPFGFHSPAYAATNPSNDYLMARAAIVPHDIRIEAVMFAEEGSFFVIPGQWFNPNPNDRRDLYFEQSGSAAQLQQGRLENFGNYPEVPFYGEPLDVKVTIVGSISENMPPPASQQVEWLKKWGWIPREHGASGELIPSIHVPTGYNIVSPSSGNFTTSLYVPNLIVKYDPSLGTGRVNGFDASSPQNTPIRIDPNDPTGQQLLPPLPRMPVSPSLFYFGEVAP